MTKMLRIVATLVLAGMLLVVGAGSVSAAAPDVGMQACWNNCGIVEPK